MICRKAKRWISLEMDGELSIRRREKLYNHIRRCSSCRSTRDKWLSLGGLLRDRVSLPVQTAEAAWADVRRAIRLSRETAGEESLLPIGSLSWRWAGVTAVVLGLGLALGIGLWWRARGPAVAVAHAPAAEVEWVETGLPEASTMVYEDQQSGWLVIWVVEHREREGDHAGS